MFDHGKGPFGKGFMQGFGPRGFGVARFERGDLKLVILSSLAETPRHGYDIIQWLEQKFQGFYSPSPGSVYPILQMLEDQGYVTGTERSGKKVYAITDEGRAFLKEHAEEIEQMQSRMGPPWAGARAEWIHALRGEIGQTAQLIFGSAAQGRLDNEETLKRVHEAFGHFREELKSIFDDA